MKIEIDVSEWWTVTYQESFQNHDQRDGAYTSWLDKSKTFLEEKVATEMCQVLKKRDNVRNIILSHVREF